jgi:hypothetical protein
MNQVVQDLPHSLTDISWRPVLCVHATFFRPRRQHAGTSPVIHQTNQLAAFRRWEDLADVDAAGPTALLPRRRTALASRAGRSRLTTSLGGPNTARSSIAGGWK